MLVRVAVTTGREAGGSLAYSEGGQHQRAC